MSSQWMKRLAGPALVLLLAVVVEAAETTDLARVKQAEAARVKLVGELSKTVVAVFREPDRNGQQGGGGSGVIIGTNGTALTNFHVVAENQRTAVKKVMVGTSDGALHEAEVVGTDPTGDIAVIRIKDGPFEAARLGDSDKLEAGDWVLAMGNPFLLATDFAPTVSLGIVSGNHRYLPGTLDNSLIYTDCIQIDAAINPGNSGGPLFNIAGELVGINGRISGRAGGRRATTQVNTGVGFAIPINQIKLFLPDLTAGKQVRHGILGVKFEETADEAKVFQVVGDSPADKAGIKVGDRITRFQGRDVNTRFELMNRIGLLPAGSTVTLTLERDGQPMTVQAKLDAMPVGDEFAMKPAEESREEPAVPGPDNGVPTPEQVVKRYAEVIGGYQKLEALKTVTYNAKVRVRLPSGVEIAGTQKVYQRDHVSSRVETNLRMGGNLFRTIITFNGKKGWRSTPNGVDEMTADDVKDHLAESKAFEQLETPNGWAKLQTEYVGVEKVGTEECNVIKTTDEEAAARKWFFSTKTGLLLKYSHYSPSNKSDVDDYFEDYRDVGGVKQPFRLYRMASGVRTEMVEVQDVVPNPELNDALFDEPPKQTYGPKVY